MARPDPADPADPADPTDRAGQLAAIAAHGRQSRKPVPRGLWIAAALVVAITAIAAISVALGGAAAR